MNNDLISRSDIKTHISELMLVYSGEELDNAILNAIDNAETVEYTFEEAFQKTVCENRLYCPARPQGECVKVKEYRMSIDMSGEIATLYKCSECGRTIAILPSKLSNYPFCHCGAEMKGGTEK